MLEFLWVFQSVGGCAKGTRTAAIGTIDFVCLCLSQCGFRIQFVKTCFDIQEMVAPVSNKDIVLLLLNVTGKFVLLYLTSVISFLLIVIPSPKRD